MGLHEVQWLARRGNSVDTTATEAGLTDGAGACFGRGAYLHDAWCRTRQESTDEGERPLPERGAVQGLLENMAVEHGSMACADRPGRDHPWDIG